MSQNAAQIIQKHLKLSPLFSEVFVLVKFVCSFSYPPCSQLPCDLWREDRPLLFISLTGVSEVHLGSGADANNHPSTPLPTTSPAAPRRRSPVDPACHSVGPHLQSWWEKLQALIRVQVNLYFLSQSSCLLLLPAEARIQKAYQRLSSSLSPGSVAGAAGGQYTGVLGQLMEKGKLSLDVIKANVTELMAGGVDTVCVCLFL